MELERLGIRLKYLKGAKKIKIQISTPQRYVMVFFLSAPLWSFFTKTMRFVSGHLRNKA